MGLFLRLEGVLHILDVLVQAAGDGLHRFRSLLLERFLAGLEDLLVLQGQCRLRRLNRLLLPGLEGREGLLVAGADLIQRRGVLPALVLQERLGRMDLGLFPDQRQPRLIGGQNPDNDQDNDDNGRRNGRNEGCVHATNGRIIEAPDGAPSAALPGSGTGIRYSARCSRGTYTRCPGTGRFCPRCS